MYNNISWKLRLIYSFTTDRETNERGKGFP